MKFDTVTSSYINEIGYDEDTKELRVKFKNGAQWKYLDVPPAIHVSLLLSESTGKYFIKEVKNAFTARKVEPEDEAA